MSRRFLGLLIACFALTAMPAAAQPARPALQMWRLDCGEIDVPLFMFSDTFRYIGERRMLTDSCYLIRNGDRYLLWDSGLPGELVADCRKVWPDILAIVVGPVALRACAGRCGSLTYPTRRPPWRPTPNCASSGLQRRWPYVRPPPLRAHCAARRYDRRGRRH